MLTATGNERPPEVALRESEARTRLLVQASGLGLWEWDFITNQVYFSPEWKAQLGYAEHELPNYFEEWECRVHPDDLEATLDAVHDYREGRRPFYDAEFRMRHRDGSWRWIFARADFLRDASGEAFRMMGCHIDITERKRSEAALRASEERLKHALDATLDGLWDWNILTGDVHFSAQWARLLGYDPGEVPDRVEFFYTVVHPDDAPRMQKALDDHLAGRTSVKQDEIRLRMKSGEYRWFLDRGKVVERDEAGQPTRMVGTITDISERKRTEAAQLARTAFFEAMIDSPVYGYLVVDQAGRKLHQNARMSELWKIPREIAEESDDRAQFLFMKSRTKDPEAFANKVEHLYAHHTEVSRGEIELIDGTILDRTSAPVLGKDGEYLGRIWTFRDITARKHTDERFRRLFESNAQGIAFWNTNGLVSGANDAFLKTTGYTREDLENGLINWIEMTPPEYAAVQQKSAEELAATGTCAAYEKEYIRKDGSRVPVLVGKAMLEHSPGEGVAFVLDLTERKELERQLLRAQRVESIGTLAGGIAHDLNNVLGPIVISLELLRRQFPDRASQDLIDLLATSANAGANMVKQVLSFARGVEGRRVEVQLRYTIQDIVKLANDTFLKHIEVDSEVARNLSTVLADPTQIHQVLLNLAVNARDAMPNGGRLSISAENVTCVMPPGGLNQAAGPGPYVLITVTDTGVGIAPQVIDKIFDPFFTTKDVGQGTGLGLSTSLAIVKAHGGDLRVSSRPGHGTTFQLYIPAMRTPAAEPKTEPQSPARRGAGELVLIVDDEFGVREMTARVLQFAGFRAVVARTCEEALTITEREGGNLAAAIVDMMMPGTDGGETIRQMRAINPELPILAASGLPTDSMAVSAEAHGADHFLAKPFTAETLLGTVQKVMSIRTLRSV